MSAVSILLIGAVLAFHVDEVRGVDDALVSDIVAELRRAVGERTGEMPAVDVAAASKECARVSRCVQEIRARTKSDEIVFIRLFGGPTRIRVLAERTADGATELAKAAVDFSRDSETWAASAETLALTLVEAAPGGPRDVPAPPPPPLVSPEPAPPVAPPPLSVAEAPEEPSRVWPWILLAGSATLAAGAGISFGVSRTAYSDYHDTFDRAGTIDEDKLGTAQTLTVAALLLGVTAVAAGGVAVYGLVVAH